MKPLPLTCLLTAITATVSAQVVTDRFEFNDTLDAILENTANSGTPGTGTWSTGTSWSTNGAGQLVIGTGAVGPTDIGYKLLTPSSLGSSLITYEVTFGDWQLDDVEDTGATFRNFGIQLRDSGGNANLLDLQFNNRTNDRLRLRLTTSNGDYGNTIVTGFNDGDVPIINTGTDYTMGLQLDQATGAYNAYVRVGGSTTSAGSGTFTLGEIANFDVVRFYYANQVWNTIGDFATIEEISITVVPEPAAFALLGGLMMMGLVGLRRRR